MTHYVYAAHLEAPISVCRSAFLLAGERGEGGYDIGVNFSRVEGLVGELRRLRVYQNEINRLVLVAHGLPGAFWIDHQPSSNENIRCDPDIRDLPEGLSTYFSTSFGWTFRNLSDPQIVNQLHLVGHYLNRHSEVVFLGCNVGADTPGDLFLTTLSTIWPGVRLVGFPVIIAAIGNQVARPSEHCMPPGMVATAATGSLGPRRYDVAEPDQYRQRTSAQAWANSSHSLAKIAQNGSIIHRPSASQ